MTGRADDRESVDDRQTRADGGGTSTADVREAAAATAVVGSTATARPWHRQAKGFAVRSLRELLRNRVVLFWAILWPVFWYFLTMMVFVPDEPPGVPASEVPAVMASIKATNAISFGLFGAFTVTLVVFAKAFTDDLDSKRYRKLRSLPISPSADLAGRFAAGFLLAMASFWTVVAVGYAHGAAFAVHGPLSIPIVLASLLLFCIIGMAVAVVLSTLVPKGEHLTAISNTVLLILFFATGYNGVVPSQAPMRDVLNYVPNALATRLQVYHLTDFDRELGGVVPPELPHHPRYLLVLALFALVFWLIALATMRRSVYAGEGGE